MRTKGWMVLAFCLVFGMAMKRADASTDVGQIIEHAPIEITRDLAVQDEISETLAEQSGGLVSDFRLVITDSSHGEFVPAVAMAVREAKQGGYDAASADALYSLFMGGNGASSGELLAGLNTANGVAGALPGVNAAKIISEAVGGTGGVVASRQNVIMEERRSICRKFGSDAALAASMMNREFIRRFWASPFYVTHKGDKNKADEACDFKAYGLSLGYDHAMGPITVGTAFTYSNSDYSARDVHDDNSIKNYSLAVYGQYYDAGSGFFVWLSGGYNYADNEWARYVKAGINRWQRGDNHTNSYWVGGSAGKHFRLPGLGGGAEITPSIGLYWNDNRGSGYKSRGVFNQVIGTAKAKTLQMPMDVAVRFVRELDDESKIVFRVHGGYSYAFKNDRAEGTMRYDYAGAETFSVIGSAQGRHGWNAGAGVKYHYQQFDVGIDYRYDGRNKYDGHRISATAGVTF